MLFKNILAISATAAVATAESVYLYVKSSNSEINGNSLASYHEGAGINYFFLGSGPASALTYDSDKKTIYSSDSGFNQYFTVYEGAGYTGLTVMGPNAELTFDDKKTLLINGTSDALYACKNTNDPYNYSNKVYELMYFTADAPSGCVSLSIVNGGAASSSAAPSSAASATTTTSAETTTVSTSCTSSAPAASTYTDAANQYAPAGAFAAIAAAAAAALL